MTNFFERIKVKEDIKIILTQMRFLKAERVPITGYLTVTKNKGQENEQIIIKRKKNLLTLAGRDYFHAQNYTNTVAGGVGMNFVALSADSGNPVAGDTVLTGEITTDGLARVLATTKVHVGNSDTTTLEEVFTATGPFTAIHKSALFNQLAVGGTISHSAPFANDVSKDVDLIVGDKLTIEWILVMGA